MSKNFKGIYGSKGGGIGSLLGVSEPTQLQPAAIVPEEVKPVSEEPLKEEPLILKALGRQQQAGNILPATSQPKRGRPATRVRTGEEPSIEDGCLVNETRATFIVNKDDLAKLKDVAYWERLTYKAVIGSAIKSYIEKYEQKNGAVKPKSGSKE